MEIKTTGVIVFVALVAFLMSLGIIQSRRGVSERVQGVLDSDREVDRVAVAGRKKKKEFAVTSSIASEGRGGPRRSLAEPSEHKVQSGAPNVFHVEQVSLQHPFLVEAMERVKNVGIQQEYEKTDESVFQTRATGSPQLKKQSLEPPSPMEKKELKKEKNELKKAKKKDGPEDLFVPVKRADVASFVTELLHGYEYSGNLLITPHEGSWIHSGVLMDLKLPEATCSKEDTKFIKKEDGSGIILHANNVVIKLQAGYTIKLTGMKIIEKGSVVGLLKGGSLDIEIPWQNGPGLCRFDPWLDLFFQEAKSENLMVNMAIEMALSTNLLGLRSDILVAAEQALCNALLSKRKPAPSVEDLNDGIAIGTVMNLVTWGQVLLILCTCFGGWKIHERHLQKSKDEDILDTQAWGQDARGNQGWGQDASSSQGWNPAGVDS